MVRRLACFLLISLGCVLMSGCGGGSSTLPVPHAWFIVLKVDACTGVWWLGVYGIYVGCTVQNVGNACGTTRVRLFVRQAGRITDQSFQNIYLCSREKGFVEDILWRAKPGVRRTTCHCEIR